jgi:uncharacterized protein
MLPTMKIGIFSDTHDHLDYIRNAVALFNEKRVDLVLHAGDHVAPFVIGPMKALKCPVIGVFGNNDGEKVILENAYRQAGELHVGPWHFTRGEYGILLMHEPFALNELLESGKFNLIVYGHTHKKDIRKHGSTLLVNPGECCGWVNGEPSVAIADLAAGEVASFSLK